KNAKNILLGGFGNDELIGGDQDDVLYDGGGRAITIRFNDFAGDDAVAGGRQLWFEISLKNGGVSGLREWLYVGFDAAQAHTGAEIAEAIGEWLENASGSVGSFNFKTHALSDGYVDAGENEGYRSLVESWSVNG